MNLWEQVLARVEAKVNRHSFYTWFRPTSFIGEDAATVTVRVPNALFKDWLTNHYHAPSDDINQPVDLSSAALYEEIMRKLLVSVANADARPQWKPDSFFRRYAK